MKDLERYLTEMVHPTINDFEANPTSVRHAFIACVVTFHAIDYLAHPKNSRGIRQKFRHASADFALLDQIAHAFKHVVTGVPARPEHLRAGDVISRPPAQWDKAMWDLSLWDDTVGGVTLQNDRQIDVLALVKRTAAFLQGVVQTASGR